MNEHELMAEVKVSKAVAKMGWFQVPGVAQYMQADIKKAKAKAP